MTVELTCDRAARRVAPYLDGELSEAEAAPLRRHLLGCVACREVAKQQKALGRWLVAGPATDVPAGFAARVARRAFAGDPGVREPAAQGPAADPGLLRFVLRLTVAAAALLLVLAAAIRFGDRPATGGELRADDVDAGDLEEIYGPGAAGFVDGAPPERPASRDAGRR